VDPYQHPDRPREDRIRRWSTQVVPAAARFDYWMTAVTETCWPISQWRNVSTDFEVEFAATEVGCITSIGETISGHRARRTPYDVARSIERTYHLFANVGRKESARHCWAIEHLGRSERIGPGDLVLVGDGQHQTDIPDGFEGVILKLPTHWIRTWLPDPDVLAGRCIPAASRWGSVLSRFTAQLAPDRLPDAALPDEVLTDHVGSLLALVVGESEARSYAELEGRIGSILRERCVDPALAPADIARALDIPNPLIHSALGARGRTFLDALLAARADNAIALLASPAGSRLPLAEIARRCGFRSAGQCARAVRARAGLAPGQLRRSGRGAH